VRISPYPKAFFDARDRCLSEGSDLAYIPNKEFVTKFAELIDLKRQQYDIYVTIENLWFGGISSKSNDWSWLAYYQSFDAFSMWESNTPGNNGLTNIG
jgi:hypothetical protein